MLFRKIKWAYQRARYGYDDTIMWEFDSYFNQFIPPLKKFCQRTLKQDFFEYKENLAKKEVFETTLKLIDDWEKMDYYDLYNEENAQTILWKYVGEHLVYYWN